MDVNVYIKRFENFTLNQVNYMNLFVIPAFRFISNEYWIFWPTGNDHLILAKVENLLKM